METLFAAPTAVPKAASNEKQREGPVEVTLLNPKRAHAIGIYLRRMAFTNNIKNVAHAIGTFDQSTVDLEFIERMLINAPEPDEVAVIKQYITDGGEEKLLGKPEQFFLVLSTVPALSARLTSFKVRPCIVSAWAGFACC